MRSFWIAAEAIASGFWSLDVGERVIGPAEAKVRELREG
jgi:hypothetical protein